MLPQILYLPLETIFDSIIHSLHQLTVPHGNIRVLENLAQPFLQGPLRHILFQHHLQESAPSRAADHLAIHQIVHGIEYLVDQGVGRTGVDHLAELPVPGQQLRKSVHIPPFQFKAHEGGYSLYLVQGIDRVQFVADIAANLN